MAKAGDSGADVGLNLRQTGILPLDPLPWGAHICLFYETPQDLIEANAGYFRAGLEENEFCLWVFPDELGAAEATAVMRESLADFDDYLAAGAIELVSDRHWFRRSEELDLKQALLRLHAKLDEVLSRGFAGLRGAANAFWMEGNLWPVFRHYEELVTDSLSGTPMMILSTYKLDKSWAADVLNVAKVHQFSISLREGRWELLETPMLAARRSAGSAPGAVALAARPFAGHERLTPRERATLAQIVAGASNKEAARALGISPRTIEFHRANIMRKLNAGSLAELVAIVLGTG